MSLYDIPQGNVTANHIAFKFKNYIECKEKLHEIKGFQSHPPYASSIRLERYSPFMGRTLKLNLRRAVGAALRSRRTNASYTLQFDGAEPAFILTCWRVSI